MASESTPSWLLQLDQARQQLQRAIWQLTQEQEPTFDLAPLGSPLQAATSALYDALDLRGDRLDGVRRALQEVARASAQLPSDAAGDVALAATQLTAASNALRAAEQTLAARPVDSLPSQTASPLLASGDTPRLHRLTRPSLVPHPKLATPPIPDPPQPPEPLHPRTFQELEASIALMKMRAEDRSEAVRQKKQARAEQAAKALADQTSQENPRDNL